MEISKINLYEYKELLKIEIEKLSIDNLQQQVNNIRRHFNNIETLNQMELLKYEIAEKDNLKKEIEEVDLSPKSELKENEYLFKKKLHGGIVEGTNVFIAEKAARDMSLETGDVVSFAGEIEFKNLRFVRKAIEKQADDDYFLYRYCEVKYDDPLLYCDESFYEGGCSIKVDEIPYKFVIPSNVIEKFKIKEGDFVDIGFDKSNTYAFKIVWKYEQDEYIRPKTSGQYKNKNDYNVNEMFYGIDFNNSKILIMGCEPRKRYYKEAIEKCNGEFLFLSGHEQAERITAQIDNADIVLILKDFLSHAAVKIAVSHSKEIDHIFKVVDGLGIKTVVFEGRKLLLNKKYDLVDDQLAFY